MNKEELAFLADDDLIFITEGEDCERIFLVTKLSQCRHLYEVTKEDFGDTRFLKRTNIGIYRTKNGTFIEVDKELRKARILSSETVRNHLFCDVRLVMNSEIPVERRNRLEVELYFELFGIPEII